MQEFSVNHFFKGLDLDNKDELVSREHLRDASGIYLVDKNGKSLAAKITPGNHLDVANEYGFQLTSGYVPLGSVEFNGITYIFSHNPDIGFENSGEIGTFPSPKVGGGGGFDRVYRPLRNFVGANEFHELAYINGWDTTAYNTALDAIREDFNTTLFKFHCDYPIEVIVRADYDGSVNLYFTDFNNPFRVVNSGFNHVTGEYTPRAYNNKSFEQALNVFNETLNPPAVDYSDIVDDGRLMCGNYYLYLQYATESFDHTSFITESGPYQITPDDEDVVPMGITGGPHDKRTNRGIEISISAASVDRSYKYIRIAYIHYQDNQQFSSIIVDKYHEVEKIADTSPNGDQIIRITGYDNEIQSSVGEIIGRKRVDDIVKSAAFLDQRIFAAHTKESELFNDDLVTFSAGVTCKYVDTEELEVPVLGEGASGAGGVDPGTITLAQCQYKDPENTFRFTGYFRHESYPFGIVFLLKNGKETVAFPIQGLDDQNGVGTATNDKGIYRFPRSDVSPFFVSGSSDVIKVLGIKFIVDGSSVTTWMRNNVQGFYFVRGERKKNIIYQGLGMNCFNSYNFPDWGVYRGYGNRPKAFLTQKPDTIRNFSTTRCAPFFSQRLYTSPSHPIVSSGVNANPAYRPYAPFLFWVKGRAIAPSYPEAESDGSTDKYKNGWFVRNDVFYGPSREVIGRSPDRNAVLSPDFVFNKIFNDGKYYFEHIGECTFITEQIDDVALQRYWSDLTGISFGANGRRISDMYGIQQWTPVDKDSFVSYYEEGKGHDFDDDDEFAGGDQAELHLFYHRSSTGNDKLIVKNMEMGMIAYIGINQTLLSQDAAAGGSLGGPVYSLDNAVVNVVKRDPTTITVEDEYQIRNLKYFKISGFIHLDGITNAPYTETCYKGDCFVQKTYHKTLQNPKYFPEKKDDDARASKNNYQGGGHYRYAFGHVVGLITENAYNTAMRYVKDQPTTDSSSKETFYPGEAPESISHYALEVKARESDAFNTGYNQVLSSQAYAGYDSIIPYRRRTFPTRIILSNEHIEGELKDSNRVWEISAARDYDGRFGQMNKIVAGNDNLFSIMDRGCQLHSVNTRAILQTETEGDLVIGTQGQVLHPKTNIVSDTYGTQHQRSVIQSDHAFYYVDWKKRKIVKVAFSGQPDFISDSKSCSSFIYEFSDSDNPFSDVNETLDDTPVCTAGIATGYDRKYRRVLFSFMMNDDKEQLYNGYTIAFNEYLDAFETRKPFQSPFYVTINEDFFSVDPNQVYAGSQSSDFYIHDIANVGGTNNHLVFYGSNVEAYIEVVLNEHGDVSKVFDNVFLTANVEALEKVDYRTEYQTAAHTPFTSNPERYIEPAYKEDQWRVPVKRSDVVLGSHYQAGSRMRGKYMKVKLTWDTRNEAWIKSIVSAFRRSVHG